VRDFPQIYWANGRKSEVNADASDVGTESSLPKRQHSQSDRGASIVGNQNALLLEERSVCADLGWIERERATGLKGVGVGVGTSQSNFWEFGVGGGDLHAIGIRV